jgi:outer membrane immunogenic protein
MQVRNWCLAGVSFLSATTIGTGNSFAQTVNWSGPYIGAFGGYGTGGQGQHDNGIPACPTGDTGTYPNCVSPSPPPADGHYNIDGALGGALLGYGFAFNQFIVGPEADIAGSTLSGSSGDCGGTPGHVCGGNIDVMSDIRLRFGLPLGQFMPFVAGGLALDDIHAYDDLYAVSGTHWEAGWTIGAGLDYKITPNISLRLEYLYQDFGRQTFFDIAPGVPEGIRTDANIVRAGIVWNFGAVPPPAPVVAKY